MASSDGEGSVVGAPHSEAVAVGIDIGGTKVLGGVVAADGTVLARSRRVTPRRSCAPSDVEDTICETYEELCAAIPAARDGAVGMGAAGFVCAETGVVLFAPHLSWRNEPLRDAISERLNTPVLVDNDANTAAWAEWRFGAARGHSHVLMITLGTGIGGGMVVEGSVMRGAHGVAGEFGHMQVVRDGLRCECGNRGCWEQYASGNALVREARSLIEANSPVAHELSELAATTPGGLTGPLISQAAQGGDPTARELFAEVGEWLGVGLANVTAALDPSVIVIGGGVSEAGEMLLEPARKVFARTLTGRRHRPHPAIVRAELGNDAGMIGAADGARYRRATEEARRRT